MSWWINRQLRARNPQTRLAVVEKLANEGDAKSIEPLLRALKDKVADVRCVAARALVRFADRRAVPPLIGMLRDTVPLARISAAESLGKLADPVAIDKLVPLLRDQDSIVRAVAARSLHRLGWRPDSDTLKIQQILAIGNLNQLMTMGPEAMEPLLELMRYGPPNKQLAAVKTLGQINDPRLVRTMIEALHMDTPAIRIDAAERAAATPSARSAAHSVASSDAGGSQRLASAETPAAPFTLARAELLARQAALAAEIESLQPRTPKGTPKGLLKSLRAQLACAVGGAGARRVYGAAARAFCAADARAEQAC